MTDQLADLVRLVDDLEARAEGYLTLVDVEAAGGQDIESAIDTNVLLVDHRTRFDIATGRTDSLTVCRLNRQHPLVKQLTDW